jgi:CheY-like chemotaxis protein
MVRPTILLVEDRPNIRDLYARVFQDAGARVLSAADAHDAYEVYRRQAFEISALVTDLRLESDSTFDISGVALAARIAEVDPELPLYGLTAFEPQMGEAVLHEVLRKTVRDSDDPASIYKHIPRIIDTAQRYDDARFGNIPEELLQLKAKYRISAVDFERLISSWRIGDLGRLALLAWHDSQLEPIETERSDATSGGRTIQFVAQGSNVDCRIALQDDMAAVTRATPSGFLAELYGMPLIFAHGDTPRDAISALLMFLLDCHKTIGTPDDFAGHNIVDVVRFRAFLDRLFGPADDGE